MEKNKNNKKKPLKLSSTGRLQIRKNLGPTGDKPRGEGNKKTIQIVFRNKNNQQNQILRISLKDSGNLFPEISGNQQRFTIRFLEWSTTDNRAMQSAKDVKFKISIC